MKIKKNFVIVIFILSLVVGVTAIVENLYYYDIEIYYKNGTFEVKSINIEFYEGELINYYDVDGEEYSLEIIDNKETILNKSFFSIPNFIIYDNLLGNESEGPNGLIELDEVLYNLYVPYYDNSKEVVFYDSEEVEVARAFLSQFSRTGFNIKDFGSLDNSLELVERVEDDVVYEKEDFMNKFKGSDYKNIIISLIVVLVLLVVVFVIAVKKKWK